MVGSYSEGTTAKRFRSSNDIMSPMNPTTPRPALWTTASSVWLALLAHPAMADTVKLANGNFMEGKVVRQSKTEVVLDIGYGTAVLRKSDIADLILSPDASVLEAGLGDGGEASGALSDIHDRLQSLRRLRDRARVAKAEEKLLREALPDRAEEDSLAP